MEPRPSGYHGNKLAMALADIKTGKLPDLVQMAIGMKAMVLLKLATEADIVNGTRAEAKFKT